MTWLLLLLTTAMQGPDTPADLVLVNGKLVTVDPQLPRAESLAVRGQRIVAVGSAEDTKPYIGPQTKVIDLGGRLAVPGFIEGHGHFTSRGQSRMILDLSQARSWDEIVRQVGRAALTTPKGKWIVGRGWHQGKWSEPPQPNVDG